MNFQAVGDLAQNLMTRKQGNLLRNEVSTLTTELTNGERSDLAASLRGNFLPLASLEHDLKMYSAYEVIQREAATLLNVAQDTLDAVRQTILGAGSDILVALTAASSTSLDAALENSDALLSTTMAQLNVTHSNKAVFSGDAFNEQPLEPPETLLDELRLATASATDRVQFQTAIDDFFADGGGFDNLIYRGSDTLAGPVKIDATSEVSVPFKVSDASFKELLKSLSVLSLASTSDISFDAQSVRSLVSKAAEELIASEDGIIAMQADIGAGQSRVELASTRLDVEQNSISITRNNIVSADPFETATRLEEAQLQLQSLYVVMARTSSLTLSEFIR